MVLTVVLGAIAALLLVWLVLLLTLLVLRPPGSTAFDVLRLLPDMFRLARNLSRDRSLAPGVRLRLLLVLMYFASPVDLVPDVIPVLGFADDAVLLIFALRWVVRRAGPAALDRNWPGTPAGLLVVRRLAGLR